MLPSVRFRNKTLHVFPFPIRATCPVQKLKSVNATFQYKLVFFMYKPDVDPIGSKHAAVLYKQILLFILGHYCQAAECILSTWHYHMSKRV